MGKSNEMSMQNIFCVSRHSTLKFNFIINDKTFDSCATANQIVFKCVATTKPTKKKLHFKDK